MMKQVAVVILNWNGAQMLRQFLPDVIRYSGDAEIVVADNASTDESVQLLEREFPGVRRIVFDRNHGFAQGYQLALAQVEARYYVLLNNDVEVSPDWLLPLTEYMESHPQVAACQPKLRCHWDRGRFEYAGASGGYVDAWGYPYCRGRVMGTLEEDLGQYDEPASLLWATGAALMVRSHAYWQVGGLDGRFFAHQEEIDLCWRLRSRGYGVVCVPASKVWHLGGGTLPKDSPHKTYLNFRNNLLLLYKNLPAQRLDKVMRVRFWLDALASVQFLLSGKWGSFCAVWRGRRDFFRMRPQFEKDRAENLGASVLPSVPEHTKVSILWQYYAKGNRTFSRIHPDGETKRNISV